MKSLSYSTSAYAQLRKLSPDVRKRTAERLKRYSMTGHGDVKKLKGRSGVRLRVGDWRIIFVEDDVSILVLSLGHRRDVYE